MTERDRWRSGGKRLEEEKAVGKAVGRNGVLGSSLGVERWGRLSEAGSFWGEERGVEDGKILRGGRGTLRGGKAIRPERPERGGLTF